MKKIALLLVLMLSCTDEENTTRVLTENGYTNIVLTGYSRWTCSNDDSTCTGFRATSPTGNIVEGAVGCGRYGCSKGCTIRFK